MDSDKDRVETANGFSVNGVAFLDFVFFVTILVWAHFFYFGLNGETWRETSKSCVTIKSITLSVHGPRPDQNLSEPKHHLAINDHTFTFRIPNVTLTMAMHGHIIPSEVKCTNLKFNRKTKDSDFWISIRSCSRRGIISQTKTCTVVKIFWNTIGTPSSFTTINTVF